MAYKAHKGCPRNETQFRAGRGPLGRRLASFGLTDPAMATIPPPRQGAVMRGGMRKRHRGEVVRKQGWLLLAVVLAGCTRAEYRRAADRDAYFLTASRIVDPAFDVGRTRVEPGPTSRLADPFDPDHPPKPPDDP